MHAKQFWNAWRRGAWPLFQDVSDAMKFRKELFDLLEKASLPNVTEEQARGLLHIAVVGGGPTGVEITAELHDLWKTKLKGICPRVIDYLFIAVRCRPSQTIVFAESCGARRDP